MEEGPSLKFVLLNAAAHFSKVELLASITQ